MSALSELRASPASVSDESLPMATRIAAARALGAFGPERDAVAVLLEVLDKKPPSALRDEILLALARRAPPSAEPALLVLFAHDEQVSPALVLALSAVGSEAALRALVSALGRPQAALIAQVLLGVGPAATAPLVRALNGPLAVQSARLLGELGARAGNGAQPALLGALGARAPELRAAAALALGQLGDTGVAPALMARLSDRDPHVVGAALHALARVASPAQAESLLRYFARASVEQRPLVLRAIVHADPARASALLASAVRGEDRALAAVARELLESAEVPDPSWIGSLAARFASDLNEAGASALSRVPEGRGVPALLVVAERAPEAAERSALALALALRRFADELDAPIVARAHALLRSLPPGERRLVLCALARDAGALRFAIEGLSAPSASRRAAAAQAVLLLGDRRADSALRAALLREHDAEAARRMSEAALELGVAPALHDLWRLLRDAEAAPEAMQLAAASARQAPPRALRVFLRRALSSSESARTRAAAALALARLGDAQAVPALQAALSDASPRVRLSAVRALLALDSSAVEHGLRVHARVERDPLVRDAARQAVTRAGVPSELTPRGDQVLELRLRVRGDAELRPLVDVLLSDGRWLRMRAQAGGELIVTDLPKGLADVRALD